uniref:Uncharacterized protein n=1 Tax=Oryza brachyantha TaxID=4533 RepID=J3LAU4_ORYBR
MGNGETRNLACPYSTYPGKGRRDGVWTGNRGVTKASPASGSTKAQEGTARLGVKEGVKPEVWFHVGKKFETGYLVYQMTIDWIVDPTTDKHTLKSIELDVMGNMRLLVHR